MLAQRSATLVMRRPIPYPRRRQATGCCPRGQTGLLKCHRKEGLRSQIDWNSCPFRQILIEISNKRRTDCEWNGIWQANEKKKGQKMLANQNGSSGLKQSRDPKLQYVPERHTPMPLPFYTANTLKMMSR